MVGVRAGQGQGSQGRASWREFVLLGGTEAQVRCYSSHALLQAAHLRRLYIRRRTRLQAQAVVGHLPQWVSPCCLQEPSDEGLLANAIDTP